MSWHFSLEIEHKVAEIISQQERNGWKFDVAKAERHCQFLGAELDRIYSEVRPNLRYELEAKYASVSTPFKRNGEYLKRVLDYWGEDTPEIVGGPYTPVSFAEPDLGSRQKVIKQLEAFGWRPLSYTEKGNPQLDEESLKSLDNPIGEKIALWYVFRHRKSQIEGWLKAVRPDGRIPAKANPCGTPTGRMRHSVVVNVPTANADKETGNLLFYPEGEVIFGTEMRELFIAEEGYTVLGFDAKGLELRGLSHYMRDLEFQEAVLHGDPHMHNADKIGMTKKVAKPLLYAMIYGAGDPKLGSFVGGGAKEGKELRELLMAGLPQLKRLIDSVKVAAKRGYLIGLDGRRMPVRSEHSALNLLIQGAGAVFMKVVMVLVDKYCKDNNLGLDIVKKVGDFHDESQQEIIKDDKYIELFSSIVVKSFTEAEKILKLRCPMGVDIKVGPNWAYTH